MRTALALVGAFRAGRMWVHHGGHGWFDRHRHCEVMRSFLRVVPEPRRAELRELLRNNRAFVREERNKLRDLHKSVRDVILREPFDKAAVVAAKGEVNAARQALGARFATELVNILERMSPDERKAFVEKGLRRGGGHYNKP